MNLKERFPKLLSKIDEELDELRYLIVVDENNELVGEVYHQDLVMKFVEFALKDEMTGLNNQRFLETIIQRYNQTKVKIGVIFVDIDNFKYFNDKFGHKIGDEVIKFVANSIKESIRDVDFGFRYGGDEFVVMVFEQEKEIVLKIARRIFDKITNKVDKRFGKVSVSIGVALYPEDNNDLEKVIELADKELYIAKNSGKGKIESID